MHHFISELTIKNYKSCIDTHLKVSPFTALVGYNNAGKSNALSALQWLVSKSKLGLNDFNDEELPVEVSGKIVGITEDILNQLSNPQKASIEPYIQDDILRIRRVQATPTSAPVSLNLTVWNDEEGEWLPNPNGIDNAIKALLPDPIRIGAMENAADDASKAKTTSTIGKLLATFLEPVKRAHEDELSNHLNEVSRLIAADGTKRFAELNTIDEKINKKIDNLFPGMSLKLHFNTPTFEDLFKSGTIKVYENEYAGRDFSSYGHGAQRAIQMALIQYLAEVKRADGNSLTTTLLLIDEPELYLHPFAIEQVREALLILSNNGYQVIISTHSAQMITARNAENTLLIRKDDQKGTYARERLADAIQSVVPDSIHQMEHLFSLSHSTQVLFSEKVVLTEGKTELRLLPFIYQNKCKVTMGQEMLSLIPLGGVGSTNKTLQILNAMDIPTKAIVDLDYVFNGAINHGYITEDNENIATVKACFAKLENEGKITLNPETELPKNGVVKASKAFELVAQVNDAKPAIEQLHDELKIFNIWVWKNGAIEAHIGIADKNEQSWANFKADIEKNGLEQDHIDYQSIKDLISWLRE